MALFKISVKHPFTSNGVHIEPGMSVQISTQIPMSPIALNGGQAVNDAFLRVYGINLKSAGLLKAAFLEATLISR
jgi:hypothetical protein